MWLMLLNFPNGVLGSESVPKVDVVGSNPIARSATIGEPLFRPNCEVPHRRSALESLP